ncbi:probable serine/threonine-protein kinase MARK-A [Danio aesculapii]|uniref:probable serine/threonine-protein kinase MARK-A n=1 Tax=Danio aesculapii TaxID=1142201 RepID=UPI0024C05E58|nr:probable serine/threonine-protein kinase MARK-A [Danio aesculapii]
MGRVGKKFKKFCNWAFSRKSGKIQQNQCTTEGDLGPQRCSDGEAGPSNAAFISHIYTGADGVSPCPAPQKAEKKLKRLRKWFSRKFKKTTTGAQQTQPSSPQTQGSPDSGAASVLQRPVQDERVNNRCVSIQTPVKTPSTETEQHDDTECWHLCVSSLTTADISESDRASLQSWLTCASSLGTAENSESDRASVQSWHSCASSLSTSENSESDYASLDSRHCCGSSTSNAEDSESDCDSVHSRHCCGSSPGTAEDSESDRDSVHSRHCCGSSPGTAENGESDRDSVHSRHCCGSSPGTAENGESDRASVHSGHPCTSSPTPDPSVSEKSTASSSNDAFWKTERQIPVNLEGKTGDINEEYQVKRVLGRGGFGAVYAGIRRSDSQKVAIKNVNKDEAGRTMKILPYQKTVPQEVGLMYLMSRGPYVPQIIQLLDWYETPSQYKLVLERPKSCMDLQKFVWRRRKKMSESIARLVMHQVVTAANACCERDVYHSDIKPENVLINPHTFQIKLIDFGVGRLITSSGYSTFCGTMPYAPPEYYDCERFHAKPATVYSIGVMLFRMLHRKYPRRELSRIVARTWQCDRLSKECIDLICSCLQSDPDERIPLEDILLHDWFQIRAQLKKILGHEEDNTKLLLFIQLLTPNSSSSSSNLTPNSSSSLSNLTPSSSPSSSH